ncbi:type II toxin-antitoxin system VapC family toxin [Allohahella marinimesophila]|uniref:Type II toxin-antitoxin system VapC family toxin n=1 Tax=Allohahella marinimesophila TaxID=1054972 RepID=A0ABP7NI74_9GAMM
MYLLDTNVISEIRKGSRANSGVTTFFRQVSQNDTQVYLSAITVGELNRGLQLVRYRGDLDQATMLENWLKKVIAEFEANILQFGTEEAFVWGQLRVPRYENAIDKQIAATAFVYDLTLVTRNTRDFDGTGVKLLNPFS